MYSYDATGQQATASAYNYFLSQGYDGDGLRGFKVENGAVTYYLRSTVLGGAVVAEIDGNGGWQRGYVYAGGELMAVEQGWQLYWVHEDSVTKSKRITDVYGGVVSTVELDPWGANTNRSSNSAFLPQNFTSYIRDSNGGQDAMARRYSAGGRFSQPDPYGGSYDFGDPQSLNRYAYTKNDPVNFVDPTGLETCYTDIDGTRVCIPDITGTVTIYSGSSGGSSVTGILGGDTGIRIVENMPGVVVAGGGGGGQQKLTPDTLTSNQDVLKDLYCLWVKGGYGFKPTERSEWITQSGGQYGSVPWPWSAETAKETWRGPLPAGTVAQAHTHPELTSQTARTGPKPSPQDQETAVSIRLPVYVVTRNAIWKALLSGKEPVQVQGRDWWKPFEKAKVKCK